MRVGSYDNVLAKVNSDRSVSIIKELTIDIS